MPLLPTRRRFLAAGAAALAEVASLGASTRREAALPTPGGGAKRSRWRIGCYTRPWDREEYRVALDAIAEAGFRHAGLMTTRSKSHLVISTATSVDEAERIGREAKRRELRILSVYGGGIPVAKSLEAGVAGLKRLLDCCEAAGAESLLMGGTGDAKLADRYYRAIAECVEVAAAKRIEIALKPHGGLNATGPQCRRWVEKVGHASFRLWYDPGNIFYYSDGKIDPAGDAATVDGIVTGMCVKDYRPPRDVLLTPGDGRVDFPAVLRRLVGGGLRGGPLVIETLARAEGAKQVEEARRARRFVEGLVAALAEASQESPARTVRTGFGMRAGPSRALTGTCESPIR